MKYLLQLSLLTCFILTSCTSQSVNTQVSGTEFRITPSNADDEITLLTNESQTIIDIKSDFGIGSALFELVSGPMPTPILLHLHLKGLENLTITSSETTVTASLSNNEGLFQLSHQNVISSGIENPISPIHPLWMQIEIISSQSNNTFPLTDGYFEVMLPQEFIQQAGSSFEVKWVDFYR